MAASLIIQPNSQTLTLTDITFNGDTVAVYDAADLGSPVSLPHVVTSDYTLWVADDADYDVEVTFGDGDIAHVYSVLLRAGAPVAIAPVMSSTEIATDVKSIDGSVLTGTIAGSLLTGTVAAELLTGSIPGGQLTGAPVRAVEVSAAGIHAALITLGLITGP
jgi:hypothetical protein